jgi:hypothetical protein
MMMSHTDPLVTVAITTVIGLTGGRETSSMPGVSARRRGITTRRSGCGAVALQMLQFALSIFLHIVLVRDRRADRTMGYAMACFIDQIVSTLVSGVLFVFAF